MIEKPHPETDLSAEPNENTSRASHSRRYGPDTFGSLRFKDFRWLFTGTLLTNAAQCIQQITLNWLVYNLTGSGIMLGTLNLLRASASLGVTPVSGTIIDRADRRKVMIGTSIWMFMITLVLGVMLVTGHRYIWALLLFSFLAGTVRTLDMNLRQVMVFSLVSREYTPNAFALIQTGWSLMRSLGPAIGGFLILWFGAGGNFLIQAAVYPLIMLSIMQISFPKTKPDSRRGSALRDIKVGFSYVIRQPETLTFALMGFVTPLLVVPIFSVLPAIYVEDVFREGPDAMGLMMAAIGVGGIIGGFISASLGHVERRGLLQIASLFLLNLSLAGLAFATRLWMSLPLMAAAGFFEMIFMVSNKTMLQLSIPDNIRGRVTALVNLNFILSPIGGIIAGVGSDLFGGPQTITLIMSGLSALIAAGVFLFCPIVRDYRMSRAIGMNDD